MFPRSQPHNNQLDITANLINALRYTRRESFRDFRAGLLLHRAQSIVEFKRYCKDQASVPKPADSSGTSSHVTPPRERRNFSRYRSTRKSTRSVRMCACSRKMRRQQKGNFFPRQNFKSLHEYRAVEEEVGRHSSPIFSTNGFRLF